MVIRNDITTDTYVPIQFSTADLRRIKKEFRARVPDLELDLGDTDDGIPVVFVTVPGADFEDGSPCITRNERGWQMVRGGNGPLYEFASEREVAEFFIPRIGHRFGCW